MPRASRIPARRPAPLPVVPATAPNNGAGEDDPQGAADAVGSLLAQFGDAAAEYVVRIDRKDARGARDYLGSIPLSADLMDDVKAKYGGGKYRGRISTASGGYVQSIHFGIAGTPRDPDAVAERVERPSELAELKGIVAALAASIAALAEAQRVPAPASSSVAQFAEIAKVIRDLTPAPVAAGSPVDMFALMNQMLEMRDRIADDAAPRDGLAGVVDKGLDALTPLLNRKLDLEEKMMQPKGRRLAAPKSPAPAPLAPSDPVAALAAKIPGGARHYLANLAKHDKNPELYAEVVLDTLPDTVYAKLPDMLGRDDFAATLCKAVPQFAPYPAWFARLADALRASILDAESGASETPGAEATA